MFFSAILSVTDEKAISVSIIQMFHMRSIESGVYSTIGFLADVTRIRKFIFVFLLSFRAGAGVGERPSKSAKRCYRVL